MTAQVIPFPNPGTPQTEMAYDAVGVLFPAGTEYAKWLLTAEVTLRACIRVGGIEDGRHTLNRLLGTIHRLRIREGQGVPPPMAS